MKIASIILCAGKSTRMKSALSKVLHPICGKPLCAWPIEHALAIGASPCVVVVGHQANEVKAALGERFDHRVLFALQATQLGTGDAVKIAMERLKGFSGTILVLYGDTPLLLEDTLRNLCGLRAQSGAKIGMLTTTLVHPTGYGRILRNENGDINGVVEENDASPTQKQINEVNPGIYAFDAEFLHDALSGLKSHNAKNEYYLTDVIAMAGSSVVGMHVPASETLGINDREQLAEAEQILRRRILSKWMKAGVTCMDPASTYIDNDVQVGQDVLLGPGVMLLGKTKVGNNVSIGAGSILTHTTVDDHARIHPYSVCDEAHIGTKAEVGPFARLRPLARLDESTKIGNFVEVKKSHFKKGSKANHLAYVGDTDVGENCNIGAGTITCNYNGFGKHKTTLEDGVFIGSNCTLVAPLVVGEQAYVAAGSTVTKDVPSNALAISRGRQENKEGYAARIRARLKK